MKHCAIWERTCRCAPSRSATISCWDRVFAHWYSGTIRVPKGKQLKYVHAGYGSIYEQDVLLDLDRGVVVGTRLKHNAPNASVGDNSERNSGEIGDRDRGQS